MSQSRTLSREEGLFVGSVQSALIDEPLPVIPGMTAMVDIRTGERSVLSYLLRPMLKSKEALRER